MQEVYLLLKRASQILDLFLLLLKIDIHLLRLGAQSRILISSDVVLNLQISIHITDFLLLCLPEDRSLVRLGDILIYPTVIQLASSALDRANWHVSSTAEENVTRSVVMNDLLVDSAAFASTPEPSTRWNTLIHRFDRYLVECLAIGCLLLCQTMR